MNARDLKNSFNQSEVFEKKLMALIIKKLLKKLSKNLIKSTSGYNDVDRFATLLFHEIKVTENLILVKHRELHWFYLFRRD